MIKPALLAAASALVLVSTPLAAQERPAEQVEIEAGLLPVVTFRNEEAAPPTIDQRREALGVRTASVAIYRDGVLDWANSYGEDVDTQSLYQAASLSKAVASAGIVALAMERGTGLDDDISGELDGLDLALINPDGVPITLRRLLSHTNGAGVSGFPGYATDVPMPSTQQVIEGSDMTNTDAVLISADGVGSYSYSGGGYTIAQYWAETVTGEDFPALMRRYVLGPVGMERSLFAALGPDELPRDNVAPAWTNAENPVAGGWHRYPEHAAASLWTTPTEYGLFALAVIRALEGDAGGGIAPAVAHEMAQVVDNDYGLGIGVNISDGAMRIGHSGSNRGYKSNFAGFLDGDDVMVVMTDSEPGWALASDFTRTASITYGWPGQEQVVHDRLPASESELAMLAGTYEFENGDGPTVVIRARENGELGIYLPTGAQFRLVRIGNATWVDPDDAQEVVFTVDEEGVVRADNGGAIFVRQ